MAWMETERQAIVRTLHGTDPSAPTLCAGSTVARLLAHLIVREEHAAVEDRRDAIRRAPAGPGNSLNPLVAEAATEQGYRRLVDRVAAGGRGFSVMRFSGDAANLLEFVVHHEDVRRGAGEPAPRQLPPGELR